jgi:very-short-patch-repair endonuclease
MDIASVVASHGGVVHRRVLAEQGIGRAAIAAAVASGRLRCIRRSWIVAPQAPVDRVLAAQLGGRLACVSAARALGFWTLSVDRPHIWVGPHSEAAARTDARIHRSIAMLPAHTTDVIEAPIEVLAHVATCLPRDQALAVWESALRKRVVEPRSLVSVQWRSVDARALAAAADVLSDSGLETMGVSSLRALGLPVRQQVRLLGHDVDALIGEMLVVQFDGWAYHSSAADRARDNRHDARLRAAGYHVIRVGYAEVVHGWPAIEREILLAVAQGRHLGRRSAERWFS